MSERNNPLCYICFNRERYLTQSYCKECILKRNKQYKRKKRLPFFKVKDIENEEWKDIPKLEGLYQASSEGRIKSLERVNKSGALRREKILKLSFTENGYFRVQVYYPDGTKPIRHAHILICLAFYPNPLNKSQVNHKNGIKTDIKPSNLEWCTPRENSEHAIENGLITKIGEKGFFAKLTNEKAIEIYNSKHIHYLQLASLYNISPATVHHIWNGTSWKQTTKAK